MKHLLYLFPAACLIFLLPGCTKNENDPEYQDCDEEYAVGLNIYDGFDFDTYEPGLVFNGNLYYTSYNVISSSALFYLELSVYGICNGHDPNINFQLILDTANSNITCLGYLEELNTGAHTTTYDVVPNGSLYNLNFDYSIVAAPTDGPEALKLTLEIEFPTQGSYSADSTYLFSNFSSARVGVLTKHPK